jgi:hypothetical protein
MQRGGQAHACSREKEKKERFGFVAEESRCMATAVFVGLSPPPPSPGPQILPFPCFGRRRFLRGLMSGLCGRSMCPMGGPPRITLLRQGPPGEVNSDPLSPSLFTCILMEKCILIGSLQFAGLSVPSFVDASRGRRGLVRVG